MSQKLILGPPGTGKTTYLMNTLEEEMRRGVDPNRIAFLSFTKKAANEAAERAMDRFGFSRNDLPHFRTIHSMAFQQLGLKRDEMMAPAHYRELGKILSLQFNLGRSMEDGVPDEHHTGDRFVHLENFARARCMKPEDAWRSLSGDEEIDWHGYKQYRETLRIYKKEKGIWDFSDILEEFHRAKIMLDVDVAIIDEAQDLSTLQWKSCGSVIFPAKRTYIAGDDDQAIYNWSGADVGMFMTLGGDKEVLQKSHRLTRSAHRLANTISHQIVNRFAKDWHSRDEEGEVNWHNYLESVDLSEGSWLLLARNTHLLSGLTALVREQGFTYTYRGESVVKKAHIRAIQAWEALRKGKSIPIAEARSMTSFIRRCPVNLDKVTKKEISMADLDLKAHPIWHQMLTGIPESEREYYIALLRRGESLTKAPRIQVNTIHGVKGGEADNVLLITDMANRSFNEYQRQGDNEHRVMYVGVTRAKKRLHLISPMTNKFYTM